MAHRPYPVRGRALRQVLRRHNHELPPDLLPYIRRAADDGSAPVYVLSTRRQRTAS